MDKLLQKLTTFLLCSFLLTGQPLLAADPPLSAENAITDIIFEHDANDFVTYEIESSGYTKVTFARNTPDDIYNNMVSEMRKHPDINGLLPGKTGASCSRFR